MQPRAVDQYVNSLVVLPDGLGGGANIRKTAEIRRDDVHRGVIFRFKLFL